MHCPAPVQPDAGDQPADHIVEVSFKGNRRGFFVAEPGLAQLNDHVVVEADRGQDLGLVTACGAIAQHKCVAAGACNVARPARRVLRAATPEEVDRIRALRQEEGRALGIVRAQVGRSGLKMKVTEVEWQFDSNKLTVFFTAERRVDFRELVRDLARTFRTRIEMRQIGVRDEAALLGGVGRCGRELCCSTWLRDLKPVSLQLAKDQRLSLNPPQISGCCGRLMCCLNYEHATYVKARKQYPREGKVIETAVGAERVLSIDIWNQRVVLKGPDGERRTVGLQELKAEVAAAAKERGKPTRRNDQRRDGG